MSVISDIQIIEKLKNRRRIIFEDGTEMTVGKKTVKALKLEPGTEPDPSVLSRILSEYEGPSALDRALYYLDSRERSEAEIRKLLLSRAYEPEAVEYALERLRDIGYVDDRQMSGRLAGSAAEAGRYGKRRVASRMMQRGLSREVIEQALEEEYPEEKESENALELARKAAQKYASEPDIRKRMAKIQGFLARRGYGWDTIRTAVRQVMNQEDTDDETFDS